MTRRIIKTTIVLFLCLTAFSSFAPLQEFDLLWGDKSDHKGYFNVVGEKDGVVYSFRSDLKTLFFEKTNATNMALISSEKLNAPEDIQGAMGYFNNGNMVVIGGNYNRRKAFYTLHGAIINLEGEVLKPGAA